MGWNFQAVDKVMRRCIGAVIFALPRRRLKNEHNKILLPTEWNHYEGAVANTLKLPMLIIAERASLTLELHIWGEYQSSSNRQMLMRAGLRKKCFGTNTPHGWTS
jgi:hypothetical protein